MWEKDKKLIAAYRECMQTFMQSIKDGEAEYDSICTEESDKINGYTVSQMDSYKM